MDVWSDRNPSLMGLIDNREQRSREPQRLWEKADGNRDPKNTLYFPRN